VIFAFDDPVTGEGLAFSYIGKQGGGMRALFCFYEEWPAGAKGLHWGSPDGVFAIDIYGNTAPIKKPYGNRKKAVLDRRRKDAGGRSYLLNGEVAGESA
jgi:hypothetical protein